MFRRNKYSILGNNVNAYVKLSSAERSKLNSIIKVKTNINKIINSWNPVAIKAGASAPVPVLTVPFMENQKRKMAAFQAGEMNSRKHFQEIGEPLLRKKLNSTQLSSNQKDKFLAEFKTIFTSQARNALYKKINATKPLSTHAQSMMKMVNNLHRKNLKANLTKKLSLLNLPRNSRKMIEEKIKKLNSNNVSNIEKAMKNANTLKSRLGFAAKRAGNVLEKHAMPKIKFSANNK
jgi:hypothetical protein